MRALTGADDVRPLEDLPTTLGRRIKRRVSPVVFTPLAPAEGRRGTRDGDLDAAAEELVDPFATSCLPRGGLRRCSAGAVPDARHSRREPVHRSAPNDQERVRARAHARGRATVRARRPRGDALDRPGRDGVRAGRSGRVHLPSRRRLRQRLRADRRCRREHLVRPLRREVGEARGRPARADGRRTRLSLLRERHRAHVAGQRASGSRGSSSCTGSSRATTSSFSSESGRA